MPVGLHTGEVELVGHDIVGIAVHVAARVMSQAVAGEILCSCTVKDLSLGPASPSMTAASVGSRCCGPMAAVRGPTRRALAKRGNEHGDQDRGEGDDRPDPPTAHGNVLEAMVGSSAGATGEGPPLPLGCTAGQEVVMDGELLLDEVSGRRSARSRVGVTGAAPL